MSHVHCKVRRLKIKFYLLVDYDHGKAEHHTYQTGQHS
jgi:hypothetical protein